MVAATKLRKFEHAPRKPTSLDSQTVIEMFHEAGVIELRLNRPESLNSFSSEMYLHAASLLDKHSNNPNVRIIVITATGRNFCAGMDIREASQSENLITYLNAPRTFMMALMNCNRVVMACVFGSVTGIGVTLLLHCDVVFVHSSTTFQTAFPTVGMVPEFASSYLFPAFLGISLSSKFLIRNESVSAHEMERAGCVQILNSAKEDMISDTIEFAHEWSKRLDDRQWNSVVEAKHLVRGPIREKATEAIETEFKSIQKVNEHGALQQLIRAKYNEISSKRRAML